MFSIPWHTKWEPIILVILKGLQVRRKGILLTKYLVKVIYIYTTYCIIYNRIINVRDWDEIVQFSRHLSRRETVALSYEHISIFLFSITGFQLLCFRTKKICGRTQRNAPSVVSRLPKYISFTHNLHKTRPTNKGGACSRRFLVKQNSLVRMIG